MKFSIKNFSSKCDQISSFLRIWSHLLEKFLMENFIFYVVKSPWTQDVNLMQVRRSKDVLDVFWTSYVRNKREHYFEII